MTSRGGGDKHPPPSSGGRALPATPSLSHAPSRRRSDGLTTRAHGSDEEEEEEGQGIGHSSYSRRQRGRRMPSPRRLLEEEEAEEEEEEEEEAEAEEEEEAETEPEDEGQKQTEEESLMDRHSGDSDDDSCATAPDEAWMDTGMRGVEEAETIADLHRQGLPIYFTCGKFKGVGLHAIKCSPDGQGECVCAHGEEGGRKWMVACGEVVREVEEENVLTAKRMEATTFHSFPYFRPYVSRTLILYHFDASLIDQD